MLPPMVPIQQNFAHTGLQSVQEAIKAALQSLAMERHIFPGAVVGVPVGSRGIRHLPVLVREMVEHIRQMGARPLVVAAMGSHGGGTNSGQLQTLEALGVCEQSIGTPVFGSGEAETVGFTPDGTPVCFDRRLKECDALLVMNRVKPHTSFTGSLESGLVKMLAVGCGTPTGAFQFHQRSPDQLSEHLRAVGQVLLNALPVVAGIAVLENERRETADLVAVHPGEIFEAEERLLMRARQLYPRLPIEDLDLLVVDRMGKEYSGTGMDTGVIGRMGIRGVPDHGPKIGRIVTLDLSDGSHGNANGVGLADLVTRRLAGKIDFPATYLNVLTATFVERAKLPMVMESDREAIEAALRSLGSPLAPRIVRIANTQALEHLLVSPAVAEELADSDTVTVSGSPEPWPFDESGNLRL